MQPHGRITHEPDGAWTAIPAHAPATFEYATRGHALQALIDTAPNTQTQDHPGDTLQYIGPTDDPDDFTTCTLCEDTRCNGAYYTDPNCGAYE